MAPRSVREAPAPEPLHCGLNDPSHPDASNEPALQIDDIQGNILGGFNKDFQTLLFLKIDDGGQFKPWLRAQVPFISTSAEVITFNRLFKAIRTRRGEPTNLRATWVNVAFSFEGLRKLVDDADGFLDAPFRNGLAQQSQSLGDWEQPADAGHPSHWVVGGQTGGEADDADVVFIIASDLQADMTSEVNRITGQLAGAHEVFRELGENLSGGLHGHEHFKFLDGISQPGVRGRLSADPHDVLTPRQNPNDRGQGKPGMDLLWPGEFVFGYPGQSEDSVSDPGPVSFAGVEWARNGSFLVFRRLKQNVGAFHQFLNETAAALRAIAARPAAVTADFVGANLVGRWHSGAPIERAPFADNPALGDDDCANTYFEFQKTMFPIPVGGVPNPFDCVDDVFPVAPGDPDGSRCPFTGHIRKAYPRDDVPLNAAPGLPDPGGARASLKEEDTQQHRLLRRGIPFGGDASASTPANPVFDDPPNGRGLHFLAYQTSIADQFEFVTNFWVNNPDFKEVQGPPPATPPAPIPPNTQGGGHDPVIGQNNKPGQGRIRAFTVTLPDPANPANNQSARISTADFAQKTGITDWVIPTGGGYFFSPSIRALLHHLT